MPSAQEYETGNSRKTCQFSAQKPSTHRKGAPPGITPPHPSTSSQNPSTHTPPPDNPLHTTPEDIFPHAHEALQLIHQTGNLLDQHLAYRAPAIATALDEAESLTYQKPATAPQRSFAFPHAPGTPPSTTTTPPPSNTTSKKSNSVSVPSTPAGTGPTSPTPGSPATLPNTPNSPNAGNGSTALRTPCAAGSNSSTTAGRPQAKTILASSDTAALHSVYATCGIDPGNEVIVAVCSFIATATPLFRLGAIPVLGDCDENGNISPIDTTDRFSSNTRGIVATHLWGVPCDIQSFSSLAQTQNLVLIENIAYAYGTKINERHLNT